jgi:pyruvate,orthophosphate dikinase
MSLSVFPLDHRHDLSPAELRAMLGVKGADLTELTSVLDLPVPPGFVIGSDVCAEYLSGGWPSGLDEEIATNITALESLTGSVFGGADRPLLLAVRSSPQAPLDDLFSTVLNVGLNDESAGGLAATSGDERFALDTYRRFIQMFGRTIGGIDAEPCPFDAELRKAADLAGVESPSEIPADLLRYVCRRFLAVYEDHTGRPFPQDPMGQLSEVVAAAMASWNGPAVTATRHREGLGDRAGTAVVVQATVFGNGGDRSGTGLGWSRNRLTGEPRPSVRFMPRAQGNDVLDGTHPTEDIEAFTERFPELRAVLAEVFERLERHHRDMCSIEFTVENDSLWVLRSDSGPGIRSGTAAVRVATDLTGDPDIALSRLEALQRITEDHLEQILHPSFDDVERVALTVGLPASPGAAVGKVVFDPGAAAAAGGAGERVILVRQETSPEDVHGMAAAAGILTTRGGLASHAAVVARGWGTPAVCGAEAIELHGDHFVVNGQRVDEGDVISLDGSTGEVILGALEVREVELPDELLQILQWADEIRGDRLRIRANADTGEDAAVARRFGAEGIGLCRTEHMFLAEDRLPIVRQMILANSPAKEKMALSRLRMAQRDDFVEILEAMDGLPVTVRLLDPPLHEFLPDVEHLLVEQATRELTPDEVELLRAAREWREQNPMIGTRGVRLGYLKPGLYAMQVTALLEAVAERVAAGGTPEVEIMIPLTVSAPELAGAREWVTEVLEAQPVSGAEVSIGTMIETPRAALRAGDIAAHADFFSFGTNDLTQLTLGFSRDDVEGRIMPLYLDRGLLDGNPFESIDGDGVGELVRLAAERGRAARPDLKLGVCGEHGGDPASIALFLDIGVDYVSCSPYRIAVARLAAAQAVAAAAETE